MPAAVMQRLLVVAPPSDRFHRLGDDIDFAPGELEAIAEVVARRCSYRAVIAALDGRPSAYRLSLTLRSQLGLRCPIYLFSASPSASARAYALQCGATKLLADDQHLVDDLMMLLRGPRLDDLRCVGRTS